MRYSSTRILRKHQLERNSRRAAAAGDIQLAAAGARRATAISDTVTHPAALALQESARDSNPRAPPATPLCSRTGRAIRGGNNRASFATSSSRPSRAPRRATRLRCSKGIIGGDGDVDAASEAAMPFTARTISCRAARTAFGTAKPARHALRFRALECLRVLSVTSHSTSATSTHAP